MKKIKLNRFRLLGSGFTKDELDLYGVDNISMSRGSMRYLSVHENFKLVSPVINSSFQKHILEDKWIAQKFLAGIGIPTPLTYGLYHPKFGMTWEGEKLCQYDDLQSALRLHKPRESFIKPRGVRKGSCLRKITVLKRTKEDHIITVNDDPKATTLREMLKSFPDSDFQDYHGSFHGWLFQECVKQHHILDEISPFTLNTIRLITFIDKHNTVHVRHGIFRFGRRGHVGDNWSTGGVAVGVAANSGLLGTGRIMPKFGGQKTNRHPDTQVEFTGIEIPYWGEAKEICGQAALAFSGVRSIAWDVAITESGPVVIEGNADWGIPSVQVFTENGLLDDTYLHQLAELGVNLKATPAGIFSSALFLAHRRLKQSRFRKWFSLRNPYY